MKELLRQLVAPPAPTTGYSQCYWCGGGWEPIGRRMTLTRRENVYTGAHQKECPFLKARQLLGGPETGDWPIEET